MFLIKIKKFCEVSMKKKSFLLAVLSIFLLNNVSDAKVYYANVLKADKNISVKNAGNVSQGDVFCEQFKLDAAKKQYEKALKLNPQDSDAHNGLGLVYYFKTTSSDMNIIKKREEYLTFAQKEFESAIKCDASNFKAYNNLGRIYHEYGSLAKAEECYQKSLALNPKYSDAMSNLAEIDFIKNKIPDAISKYKKAISYDSKNLQAYLGLAQSYAAQSKFTDALTEANTALSLFPNSAKAHIIFGKIYDVQGNKVAAINSYRKAVSIKPENIEPYIAIAEIFQERGDNEFAISELKNALSLNPNYKEGYLKLADMSLLENKPDAAIIYYQKVINDPVFASYALKGLAKAYFCNAKYFSDIASLTTNAEYINAQNALLKAIDSNPKDLQLYLALIRISKLLANDDLSKLYLNKIISKSDFSPISSLIKGEALLLCNNYKQAYWNFSDAIADVDNVEDCIYLGNIFIEDRQYDMAQAAFYKALGFEPENKKAKLGIAIIAKNKAKAETHYDLAKSFYKHNEQISALEELKKAVAYDFQNKKAQLMLANCYEKINDNENSLEHYKIYLNFVDEKDKKYKKYAKKIANLTKKVSRNKKSFIQNL